jgi:hypothetical protein
MKHEDSLLCSQEPTSGHYPEPDEPNPHPHTIFFKIHFNITLPSTSMSPK